MCAAGPAQRIVAAAADQHVVAAIAADLVGRAIPNQHIGEGTAVEVLDTSEGVVAGATGVLRAGNQQRNRHAGIRVAIVGEIGAAAAIDDVVAGAAASSSFPPPPLSTSLPAPPLSELNPAPPVSTSLPSLPEKLMSASPAVITSSNELPETPSMLTRVSTPMPAASPGPAEWTCPLARRMSTTIPAEALS